MTDTEAVEEQPDASWRTACVLLEADKSSQAQQAKAQLLEIMSGKFTPREKGRFRTITKAELDALAKEQGLSAPGALAMIMAQEEKEGLIAKGVLPQEEKEPEEVAVEPEETGAEAVEEGAAGEEGGEGGEAAEEDGPSQEYDDTLVIAGKVALRLDERVNAPDRIYILSGYPTKVDEVSALCDGSTPGVTFDGIVTLVSKECETVESTSRVPVAPMTADDYRYDEAKLEAAEKAGDAPPPPKNPALASSVGTAIAGAMSKGSCNVGALQDICYVSTSVDDADASALVTNFNQVVGDAAIDRQMFKQYSEDMYIVAVPEADVDGARAAAEEAANALQSNSVVSGAWGVDGTLKCYVDALADAPEQRINAASVLWACVKAVAVASGEDTDDDVDADHGPWMISGTDRGSVSAAVAATQLVNPSDEGAGSGDFVDFAKARLQAKIEEGIWSNVTKPGVAGRNAMPPKPVFSVEERGIRRTEFNSFITLSPAEVERTRQVHEFGGMVKSIDPSADWNFHGWRYWEELEGAALTRMLSDATQDGVIQCTRYYPEMDTLLLALHTPTAPGRKGTRASSLTECVRTRKAFPDWRAEGFRASIPLTPRTMGAMSAVIDIPEPELRLADKNTQFFFPASHSVIRLSDTAGSGAWLSVDKDGHCFGLRAPVLLKEKPKDEFDSKGKKKKPPKKKGAAEEEEEYKASFFASFLDGSRLTVNEGAKIPTKPDGEGTVSVSNTLPTGLIVTNSSDGMVHQQYMTQSTAVPPHAQQEDWRVVLGTGAVLRMLRNGSQTVMFPDGAVAQLNLKKGVWEHTSVDGSRFSSSKSGIEDLLTKAPEESESPETETPDSPLASIEVKTEVDPETHTLVETRADGVMCITYTDGTKMVHHQDETVMIMDTGGLSVRVEAPGFATVDIDAGVEETAFKHAKGFQVAIKMGGERTRSVTTLTEGTIVETSYNTKVTADVNGRVYTRKPTGEIVTAVDGGYIEFRTREEADEMPTEERGEVDSEPDALCGVYVFNLMTGQLYLEDVEHNIFDVNVASIEGSVDLAGVTDLSEVQKQLGDMFDDGVSAKSVVNHPLPPRLFIMHGDGTGIQLHRPEDMEHFFRVCERTPHHDRCPGANLIGEDLSDGGKALCHTFLHHLRPFPSKPPVALSCYQTAEVPKARPTLPMVVLSQHPPKRNESLPPPPTVIVRHFVEIEPMSATRQKELWGALNRWESWRTDRVSQEDRFSVVDSRPNSHLESEGALQKQIMKAYKARRAKQRQEREREKEKARQAVAAQRAAAVAAGETPEPIDGNATPGVSPAMQMAEDEEDEEEYEFTDSDDDREPEAVVIAPEVQSIWDAFDTYKDEDSNSIADVGEIRAALIQVMGQGVTSSEFKGLHSEEENAEGLDLESFTRLVKRARQFFQAEEDDYMVEQRLLDEAQERGAQRRQAGGQQRARGTDFWSTEHGQDTLRIIPQVPSKEAVYDIINEETPSSAFAETANLQGDLAQEATAPAGDASYADAESESGSYATGGYEPMQGSLARSTRKNRKNNSTATPVEDKLSISTRNERLTRGENKVQAGRGRAADLDVNGNPRAKAVRMREKSKGEPNFEYLQREEGVMRTTNTASTRLPDGTSIAGIERFFEISPPALALGQLENGREYRISFSLKNVGTGPTRFKVVAKDSRPEDQNFVRLINNPPGQLGAGLSVQVEVSVKAGSVGSISDFVEIQAISERFQIPVTAEVMSPEMYDIARTQKSVCVVHEGEMLPIANLMQQ